MAQWKGLVRSSSQAVDRSTRQERKKQNFTRRKFSALISGAAVFRSWPAVLKVLLTQTGLFKSSFPLRRGVRPTYSPG